MPIAAPRRVGVAGLLGLLAGALVGAGAVVVKDVAPGEVVVGNPARALASTARQSAT